MRRRWVIGLQNSGAEEAALVGSAAERRIEGVVDEEVVEVGQSGRSLGLPVDCHWLRSLLQTIWIERADQGLNLKMSHRTNDPMSSYVIIQSVNRWRDEATALLTTGWFHNE